MKRVGFGLGSSVPTPEEVEKEAAAELRRAIAGSGPRAQFTGRGMPSDWLAEKPAPDVGVDDDVDDDDEDGPGWRNGMSMEEERRAVTDLAMQQLTERPSGRIRPEDTIAPPVGLTDAEDMRNQALAQFLQRQQRQAKNQPVSPQSRPAVVQTRSGFTVSPRITVSPTLTGHRGPSLLTAATGTGTPPAPAPGPAPGPAPAPAPANRSRRNYAGEPAERPVGRPGTGLNREGENGARAAPAPGGDFGRQPAPGRRVPTAGTGNGSPAGSWPAAADPVASPAPAVPRRSVARRGGASARSPGSEPEARWRALSEVAEILAEEVFPADTFPELSRWLAETTDSMAAVVLLAGDAIDSVAAWPADDPMAADLEAMAAYRLDERSSLWAAVSAGETIAGSDNDLVMPDGAAAEGVGGWVVVPLVDRGTAFGVIVVAGARGQTIPDSVVQLLEDVAPRVARALFNCEEAVSSGAAVDDRDDRRLPPELRDKLAAISFVLEAIDAVPPPRLAPDDDRRYRQIGQQLATLEADVHQFLTGPGDGRR